MPFEFLKLGLKTTYHKNDRGTHWIAELEKNVLK